MKEGPMPFTERVIDFILSTKWQHMPAEVRHQSRRCLTDALGALIAGTQAPPGKLMATVARSQYPGTQATLLVEGSRVSAAGAALANGFAANALDIDDGYRRVKGHPGACVLPVILAACEMAPKCSGADFLGAFVIGYEVGIRAGLIRHATYPIYHSSGSWGAIAGAAAACKLLGYDPETLYRAMGTAEYHAPIAPMMKGIDAPNMGKDSIGWGAMVAMMSAVMAKEGFTGVHPLFDDSPEKSWIENLGQQYEILNLYFKPYAACRWAQPPVIGALKICREHCISPQEISRIQIRTFKAATRLSRCHPKNTEQAQYNIAFPVAAALIDGEVGPEQVLPPRIYDQRILSLADKVVPEVFDRYEKMFPAEAGAEVVVHTKSGKRFDSGPVEAMWEPPDTLPSDRELQDKFHRLVTPVLGEGKTKQIEDLIQDVENLETMNTLVALCIQ